MLLQQSHSVPGIVTFESIHGEGIPKPVRADVMNLPGF